MSVVPLLVAFLAATLSLGAYHDAHASLAAAYARGVAAAEAGDYATAMTAFTDAGTYRDAVRRRSESAAALAPYRAAYLDGLTALQTGDNDGAIAAFLSVVRDLPTYEDAQARLDEARAAKRRQLLADADAAATRHDWIVALRILERVLTLDPGDADTAARLAELSHLHAPVLYARDGAIYTVGPDTTDERLVTDDIQGVWPAWSPDRTRIAFFASDHARIEHFGLYVVNLDGTGLRQLAPDVRLEGWPQWSPDGTRIAYDSRQTFMLDNEDGVASLHLVDVATGADLDLTSAAYHYTASPTWAPDGTRIAFITKQVYQRGVAVGRRVEGQLHVIDLRTGAITEVVGHELPHATSVFWSPRGTTLLVLSAELGSSWNDTLITTIQSVDIATGRTTDVTDRSQLVSAPVWSPDGTRFVYLEGDSTLQIRGLDGSALTYHLPRAITPFLTWSPDGSRLIAPAADRTLPSLVVDLAAGGTETDLPLTYDFSDVLAGPPLWAPLVRTPPSGPPTTGGTALDH